MLKKIYKFIYFNINKLNLEVLKIFMNFNGISKMSKTYTLVDEETNVKGIYYLILNKDILGTQNKIKKSTSRTKFKKITCVKAKDFSFVKKFLSLKIKYSISCNIIKEL
jgi:hypothetical protein